MTDVLQRGDARAAGTEVTLPLRSLIAALAAAAGTVHLAMVPSHVDEWAAEGVAFAVAGWVQLGLALAVLTRPSRALLAGAIGCNLAFVGAWAVTRTAGAPFGPHAGHAESASLVDLTTVGFEVALIVLAGLALVAPGTGQRRGTMLHRGSLVSAGAVVLLTTAVLTSPSARDHARSSHDDHGAQDEGQVAAGGDHEHEAEPAAGAPSDMATRPEDRGLSELSNGHHHEMVVHELDAETQATLDDQLAVTHEVAAAYPTVAAAEAAGYRRIGPYFPGIGAHYGMTSPAAYNPTGEMTRESLLHPFAIIYDGTEPTSRVAGFMYLSLSETEPEGFAGPNDVWHYHEQLCLKFRGGGVIDVPFGLDHEATPEQCASAGARMIDVSPWMVHVWSAPGWDDDPDVGTFGEVHTDLTCSDGTYHMLAIEQWVDHTLNVCRADAA